MDIENPFNSDITANLKALQFESSLEESDLVYLPLRNRSHSLLVNGVAQACFFIKTIHNYRAIRTFVLDPDHKRINVRILVDLDTSEKESLRIGLIGCGRIGRKIVDVVLNQVKLHPSELIISTRRPESLKSLFDLGCDCLFDNGYVGEQCHIIFMCVLASQIPVIASEMRGRMSPHTILYIVTTGMPLDKLRQLFQHDNIIGPITYQWDDHRADQWDVNLTVEECFQNLEIIGQTCPIQKLYDEDNGLFVWCSPSLYTQWLYTLCNFCTLSGLNFGQTLEIINCLLCGVEDLKTTKCEENPVILLPNDIIKGLTEDKKLPLFNLSEIGTRKTFFDHRIEKDEDLRKVLLIHYQSEFEGMFKRLFT